MNDFTTLLYVGILGVLLAGALYVWPTSPPQKKDKKKDKHKDDETAIVIITCPKAMSVNVEELVNAMKKEFAHERNKRCRCD